MVFLGAKIADFFDDPMHGLNAEQRNVAVPRLLVLLPYWRHEQSSAWPRLR